MLTADFSKGTNGANISAADAGSADAWDSVTIDANATLKYDNAQAVISSLPLAAKVVSGASPTTAIMTWSTKWGTQTDHYGRLYIYPETVWAVDFAMQLAGTTNVVGFTISGSNFITARDSANAALFTCGNPLVSNQWNRIEWHITHSTTVGFFEIKQFLGTANYQGTTPTDTQSASSANLNANSTGISFGLINNDPSITARFAAIVAQATSYPGPLITAVKAGSFDPTLVPKVWF